MQRRPPTTAARTSKFVREGGSPSLQFFNRTRYRARPRALKAAGENGPERPSTSTSARTITIVQGGGAIPPLQFFNRTRYRARARPRALKVAGENRTGKTEHQHEDDHDCAGRRGNPPSSNLQSCSLSCSSSSSSFEGGRRKRDR